MAVSPLNIRVQDENGDLVSAPEIRVRLVATGNPLATLYTDRAGATALGVNPFTIGTDTGSDGKATVYVAGGLYEIRATYGANSDTWYQQAGLVGELDALVNTNIALPYNFDDGTSGDPEAGNMRFNHATLASVTGIAFSTTDRNSTDRQALLEELDNSTSSVKARIWVVSVDDPANWAVFNLTTVFADQSPPAGWLSATVSHVDSAGSFSAADHLAVLIDPAGDKGETGAAGGGAFVVCRAVATSNIDLDNDLEDGDSIDGVTLAADDRVLVTSQSSAAENGVYIVPASGAASRDSNFDTFDEHPGVFFSITEGSVYGDTLWQCTSDAGGTIDTNDLAFVQFSASGASAPRAVSPFRLTLTSATPVTTSDVTAATTLYAALYRGNEIALYTGAAWVTVTVSEMSLALSGYTADTNYDIFLDYNGGSPALASTAWSSGTARATALALQDGVYVKSGDTQQRYLGTIRITATTGQCEDSVSKRFVWNMYNRAPRVLRKMEATANWTYTTATWRYADGDSSNIVGMVRGLDEDAVDAVVTHQFSNSTSTPYAQCAVGLDGTTPASGQNVSFMFSAVANVGCSGFSFWQGLPGLGYHFLSFLEFSQASGTSTFYSSGNHGVTGVAWA